MFSLPREGQGHLAPQPSVLQLSRDWGRGLGRLGSLELTPEGPSGPQEDDSGPSQTFRKKAFRGFLGKSALATRSFLSACLRDGRSLRIVSEVPTERDFQMFDVSEHHRVRRPPAFHFS